MSGYIDSYYSRTLADDKCFAPLTEDLTADVCVIGAGLAGLNTALELAERGLSVVVLEKDRVAAGASGRNGGFVVPGYAQGAHELIEKLGLEHTQKLYALIKEALVTIGERIRLYNIDCGPVVHGMLKFSLKEDRAGLKDYAHFISKNIGLDVEHWGKSRVRDAVATERYNDAVLYKQGFHFHALNYARGIACASVKKGVRICEQSPVVRTELKGNVKILVTAHGNRVSAKHVVFACSGYIGNLYWPLSHSVVPVSTYVMATEPLGERLKDVIRVPYCLLDNRFANDYYRPLSDTRILWGGRVSVTEPSPEKIARLLRADMLKVFPQLADVKIETAWGGFMGYARHKMPQIGMTLQNVWHCTAFGGYGLAATTAGARVLADAMVEKDADLKLFKPFGLAFTGGPLIAPAVTQVMYWGYQAADRIKALAS